MTTRPFHSRVLHRQTRAVSLATVLGVGLGLTQTVAAETIYRTTEPDGTVIFTDQAAPDAVVVDPSPISVISTDDVATTQSGSDDTAAADDTALESSPTTASDDTNTPSTAAASTESDGDAPVDEELSRIDEIIIASPPAEATLLDPAGPLIVEVGTSPGTISASGQTVEVLLDGSVVAVSQTSQLALPELLRGEHELQVRLVDENGRVSHESEPQALFVRRTIINQGSGN